MTAASLSTIQPRLRKLVLLLSSDRDGEVVAAARAIGRILKDAGADWHALADVITVSAHAPNLPRDWREMAYACRSQGHRLSPKEFDFINNVALSRREPSEKQLAWLLAIFERIGDDA